MCACRVGRTGRAGRRGTATSYIAPYDARHAPELLRVLRAVEQPCPDWLVEMAEKQQVGMGMGMLFACPTYGM